MAARGADLGLFEVDEGALPRRSRGRGRASSRSRTSSATSSTATASSSSSPSAGARPCTRSRQATLVVNADDPVVGRPRGRPRARRSASGSTTRGTRARRSSTPPTRSTASAAARRTTTPPRTSGTSATTACPACGHARPPLDVAARDIELTGLDGLALPARHATAELDVELTLPGLYNVYNAAAAASLAFALGAAPADVRDGLAAFSAAFGRFERFPPGAKSIVILLIKNPAGANEALRTLETGVPPVLVVALNDEIADGQDVSWIWDVDFEPLLPHVGRIVATGERAAELALRLMHGGSREERLELVPDLERALDRGLELVDAGTDLVILPTYTAMLALRGILTKRGSRAAVLGGARVRIRVGHLYPDYLNIYADRGNIAVLDAPRCAARTRARAPGDRARRRARRPAHTTCSTSAAARIASRR